MRYPSKYIKTNNADFALLNPNVLNPGTGALVGGTIGAIKGGLEQDPYKEIDPGDRLGRVLMSTVAGTGVGAGLGILPIALAQNPTLQRVNRAVQRETGTQVLPRREWLSDKVARIKADRQAEWDRKTAPLRDTLDTIKTNAVEDTKKVLSPITKPLSYLNPFRYIKTNNVANAAENLEDVFSRNSYMDANFAAPPPILPQRNAFRVFRTEPDTLNKTLAVGAGLGTVGGLLYGASEGIRQNRENGEQRLARLENIVDPYTRVRQQEIYDSEAAKIGRTAEDAANIATTSGGEALKGAVTGGLLGLGALAGYKALNYRNAFTQNPIKYRGGRV